MPYLFGYKTLGTSVIYSTMSPPLPDLYQNNNLRRFCQLFQRQIDNLSLK